MVTKEVSEEDNVAGPRNGLKTMKELDEKLKNGLTKIKKPDESKKDGETIEGKLYDFEGENGRMLRVHHDNVKIRNCKFRDNKGEPVLVIANGKNVVVEDCIFEDITAKEGDNREPLRIGEDGSESGVSLNCTVRRCIFRNNSAEAEIISIKSVDNTIEHCFFINNDGNLTVRHGGRTRIRNNYFTGNNGVRIYGYGNRVENNCFEENSGTESRTPIGLWYGNRDYDENWIEDKSESKWGSKPTGNKNKQDQYARAVLTVIRGNEFKKSCTRTIADVKDGKSKEPQDTKRGRNEEELEKFTFEKNEE
jgi:hypothetical protein